MLIGNLSRTTHTIAACVLILLNLTVVLVALLGLFSNCVSKCWNGVGLHEIDDIKFISKHFMHCKYAINVEEYVWPWLVLFLSLPIFTQWFISIELLLTVHTREVITFLRCQPQSHVEHEEESERHLLFKPLQSTSINMNDIDISVQMSVFTGSNAFVRTISGIAFITSCTGIALVIFWDHEGFAFAETCLTDQNRVEFNDMQPQNWHFIGFACLFIGIGLQHVCAALVYYYMVVPTTCLRLAKYKYLYRSLYIGLDGIFIVMLAVFVLVFTLLEDYQPSIYMEYALVFAVLFLSTFNVVVCCRMLHHHHDPP
jgi:hypothetical protein